MHVDERRQIDDDNRQKGGLRIYKCDKNSKQGRNKMNESRYLALFKRLPC
jgi:hypothetical protein